MDWRGQVEVDHVWYMTWGEWILLYIAFCTIMAISRKKEVRSRDYALLLFRKTSKVLYSVQYHRQHCTLQAFEQFGALYMHSHDNKYPARPAGTFRLKAPVDTNEPSGPANNIFIEHVLYFPILHANEQRLYFLNLKLCLATATHSFKWAEITHICLIWDETLASLDV